jgi:diguanylate cyclase (GGDEF)-like protein
MPLNASLPARDEAPRPALGLWGPLIASVRLIGDKGPAGRLLRLILPLSVVTVGISGPALYAAHELRYVGIAEGVALFAAITVLLIFASALRAAWLLNAEHRALSRLRAEVQSHALHDPQTGLVNRGQFMEQLARRAALADRRTSAPFAVCSLELEGIGEVVGRLGESAGNRILAKAADVIRDCVRASDLVARLEGGKFGILLEEIADARDIDILAQRIVSSVPPALAELAAGVQPVTVSIGIVTKSSGQDRPGEMLREADAALQVAKRRGPGRFELTAFTD